MNTAAQSINRRRGTTTTTKSNKPDVSLKFFYWLFVLLFAGIHHLFYLYPSRVNYGSVDSTILSSSQTRKQKDGKIRPAEEIIPLFFSNGEASEQLLHRIDKQGNDHNYNIAIQPIGGNWSHKAWTNTYDELHGNNMKVICHLVRTSRTKDEASKKYSDSSNKELILSPVYGDDDANTQETKHNLPYRVVVRPFIKGGGTEYLAYVVARELYGPTETKIPTQHVLPTKYLIDNPWVTNAAADYVNIQSLLYGVQLTFIDEWTNCIPRSTTILDKDEIANSNKEADNFFLDIGNNNQRIRLEPIQVDESKSFKLCLRNMKVYDGKWKDQCFKQGKATRRQCYHSEVSQLVELALFDALIANGERLHLKGASTNNLHWVWPYPDTDTGTGKFQPRIDANYNRTLKMVWLDHGHYTFVSKPNGGEMIADFFKKYCVFSGLLLQRIFGKIVVDADDKRDSTLGLNMSQIVRNRLIDDSLADKLMDEIRDEQVQVLDQQIQHIRDAVLQCASKNNNARGQAKEPYIYVID